VLVPQAMFKFLKMSTVEIVSQLLNEIRSECATIFSHRDRIVVLAIESAYTNLGAAALISMPAGTNLAVLGIRNRS
jgi:hypothetical protein